MLSASALKVGPLVRSLEQQGSLGRALQSDILGPAFEKGAKKQLERQSLFLEFPLGLLLSPQGSDSDSAGQRLPRPPGSPCLPGLRFLDA